MLRWKIKRENENSVLIYFKIYSKRRCFLKHSGIQYCFTPHLHSLNGQKHSLKYVLESKSSQFDPCKERVMGYCCCALEQGTSSYFGCFQNECLLNKYTWFSLLFISHLSILSFFLHTFLFQLLSFGKNMKTKLRGKNRKSWSQDFRMLWFHKFIVHVHLMCALSNSITFSQDYDDIIYTYTHT